MIMCIRFKMCTILYCPVSKRYCCVMLTTLLIVSTCLADYCVGIKLASRNARQPAPFGEMAQRESPLDQFIYCSICLDPLQEPVTTSCGHSYCIKCISHRWDVEEDSGVCSCPQCRQTFTPRPVLVKNTMLAALVEEVKKTGLQAAPPDHSYAGAEDVACDVCTGRKLKALKSCLVCLASYCEKHLQPHRDAAPLRRHNLVEPSRDLQESICPRHDEVMKMFCRTDQKTICYLCSVDEHKGHDTVTEAAERSERRRDLEKSRQKIQQVIKLKEQNVMALQKEVEAVDDSAERAVQDSKETFSQIIHVLEQQCSEVEQQVRVTQEAEVKRVRGHQKKLEKEIAELKRRDTELENILHAPDHRAYLHKFSSLTEVELPKPSNTEILAPSYFQYTTAVVLELRDKVQEVLMEKLKNISLAGVLLHQPKPKTRHEFLKYACDITLDPDTAHKNLVLSEGNRVVMTISKVQHYPNHPDRFTRCFQVLSRQALTGRCYWEMKYKGAKACIAVGDKEAVRAGASDECTLGFDDKSWALCCVDNTYTLFHNGVQTPLSDSRSCRVGVYLDHSAGLISFYSITANMVLLHRVVTTFTQPLHAGIWFQSASSSKVEICSLEKTDV